MSDSDNELVTGLICAKTETLEGFIYDYMRYLEKEEVIKILEDNLETSPVTFQIEAPRKTLELLKAINGVDLVHRVLGY